MTVTTQTPSGTELVNRTADALPLLREHARWSDDNRRLHEEVIEALGAAGVYRMRVPTRYGGYEADATTMLQTIVHIGRGDGSAAWVTAAWSQCAWITGLYPDHVQDEVFADPDTRVCRALNPTAVATPVEGGLRVDGSWHFISGAWHSQWQLVLAMAPTPDRAGLWPVMALVPMSDLEIVDDWYSAGLRGTGSVTTVAKGVFIPAERVLPMPAILQGQYATVRNAGAPMYHSPLMPTGCASFTGTAIGLAKAGLEDFLDRMPNRENAYTDDESQHEAPLTHLQAADAVLKIDEAEFHATRLASTVDTKAATGDEWTLTDRAGARAALDRVFGIAKEAVDILHTAGSGSSLYADVPIQRIERDIQALNLHALMHPTANLELYGRMLCGLQPNTMYL